MKSKMLLHTASSFQVCPAHWLDLEALSNTSFNIPFVASKVVSLLLQAVRI